MSATPNTSNQEPDFITILDELVGADEVQTNCMFQLSVMLARIALEPCSDNFKDETAQSLLGLIRNKPKSNVVPLFGAGVAGDRPLVRQTLSR